MSQQGSTNDLLINFDNLSFEERTNDQNTTENASHTTTENTSASMSFMCSTTPIYKLLGTGSNDLNDNNPFDQMATQATLSDDPFEIVENAACARSTESKSVRIVETGTLISLDSPTLLQEDIISRFTQVTSDGKCDTPRTVQNIEQKNSDNLKETPTKLVSPSSKSRNKPKSDSKSLLKYSITNSRSDLFTENGSPIPSDESAGEDLLMQKQKVKMLAMRRNSNDDSFDDIWSTNLNLIDSQTDIDVDSDTDSDLATLNIPMLNESRNQSKSPSSIVTANETADEIKEHKNSNRNDLLVKFASIKQKNLSSPMCSNASEPVYNDSVDVKSTSDANLITRNEDNEEPYTPKSQYSSIRPEHLLSANNPNSLIEELRLLVNKCDDEFKQSEAKHLLDDLSSILTKHKPRSIGPRSNTFDIDEKLKPQPIQRQGTFNIDDEAKSEADKTAEMPNMENNNVPTDTLIAIDTDASIPSKMVETEEKKIATTPDYSDIIKQIQAVLGAQQNVNVLQANSQQQNAQNVNPIIVVFPQSKDLCDIRQADDACQPPIRSRSQSLTLKDKPIAALKATQAKKEIQQRQSMLSITPLRRPSVSRRSSFGGVQHSTVNTNPQTVKQTPINVKSTVNTPTLRRRSLQMLPTDNKDPAPVVKKETATINRRRSFQYPSSASSGIRSPSPKPTPPTTSNLIRRRSFSQPLAKDSPQKMKSSYGILKKPTVTPANLKIRVTQALGSRVSGASTRTAPMKAVIPMGCIAPASAPPKDSISPIENKSLVTSTPRSFMLLKPSESLKKSKLRKICNSDERKWND